MGTGLFALGLETGAASDTWNLEDPDRVRAGHQSFVGAGSDLILTNSFGRNRSAAQPRPPRSTKRRHCRRRRWRQWPVGRSPRGTQDYGHSSEQAY
jgi:hypothetical protein